MALERLPSPLASLVLLISAAIPLAAASPSLTDDSRCGCYLTNGTEDSFFSKHGFFDFRNLTQYSGVPAVIPNSGDSASASPTSDYFKSTAWTEWWMVGSWNNSLNNRNDATVLMINSPNNIYIEANNDKVPASQTFLTLRTQRLEGFQTAAEIESVSPGFQFLSMRMLARTIGAKGAITAMFTYRGADKLADVQEADLEVLTRDPRNLVHYTNQPSYTVGGDTIEKATENATMPDGLDWTNWAVHRFDWTPTVSTWFVNGKVVANISFQTPRDSSKVIFNAWSDGGQWSGNMSLFDAAYLQIQWFDIVYNSTETKSSRKRDDQTDIGPRGVLAKRAGEASTCKTVCSIDETSKQGQPVMLWNNAAARTRVSQSSGLAAWMPSVVVLAALALSTGLLW
ncbi:concanavalin A-like lectin/glucanase domain-containing protein [Podospora appendiculata]|uniref:Concanavalin A-like lectin/glucanase domain-containing protein n=1 Tax=Podospora appendiculata TaxID=314037 RepID=A0AAE0XGB9_9PEZI|nr:concanavalin A-like lectin/glucanase domain-containing protein [Podospora appendiculata]